MMTHRASIATALVVILLLLAAGAGAEVVVYPKAGQSQDQFQQDQFQCHQLAQQQTGFNPAQPVAAAPPPERGGAIRGARSEERRVGKGCRGRGAAME